MRKLVLIALLLAGGMTGAPAWAEPSDFLVLRAGPEAPYEVAGRSLLGVLSRDHRVDSLRTDATSDDETRARIEAAQPRVLVTLGSEATRWALDHTEKLPIVFAMVLQPVQSGFIASFDHPGGRVTGAALDIQPTLHLRTLRETLKVRRVEVLYDPRRSQALIRAARRAAGAAGVELITAEVEDSGELGDALLRLTGRIDVLWSIPDRTVLGRGGVKQVLLHTIEHEIPFVGLSEQYVRAGALMALSSSLEENGRQAAERAIRVLERERPGGIAVARPGSVEVVYNRYIADRLGLRLPESARAIEP